MFPPVTQRLQAPTGTLERMPLPLLLHALWDARHSAQLVLTAADGRERRLLVRDGALVACEPGAPGETLLGALVDQGLVEPGHARRVESAAQVTGVKPEELLVQQGALAGEALERTRRVLVVRRALECFGAAWARARYTLAPVESAPEAPGVRLALLPVLLAGVARVMPSEVVAAMLPPARRLRRAVPPPALATPLLSDCREAGVLDVLGEPLDLRGVCERSNLKADEAARRMLSLALLGLAEAAPADAAVPQSRRRLTLVRFLRPERMRLEDVAVEEPALEQATEGFNPATDALETVEGQEGDADITGIIPTHRLPPLPGSEGGTDVTGMFQTPELPPLEEGGAPSAAAPAPAGAKRAPAPRGKGGRGALVAAVGVGALALGAGLFVALKPAPAPPRPEATAAAQAVQAAPPPEPELLPPVPLFAAAPPNARAQPQTPRGLRLGASGIALPLPQPARGAPLARELSAAARLLASGEAAAALARFQAAAARAPESADAWYGAASALYALERDAQARESLARALAAAPGHPASHLLLGFLSHQAAQLAEARAHYERFLAAATAAGTPEELALTADVRDVLAQLP
jgi:hypothetical protein